MCACVSHCAIERESLALLEPLTTRVSGWVRVLPSNLVLPAAAAHVVAAYDRDYPCIGLEGQSSLIHAADVAHGGR